MSKLQFKESELVSFIEDLVNEERTTLSESKERKINIWVDRFERKNKNNSPELVFENFSREINKLSRNGISTDDLSLYLTKNKKIINEQAAFTMSQNQGIFGTIWETVREGLYRWILGFMGIKDGELKEVLANTLGNVPFTDLPKLMNCNFLAPILTKGILEYGIRRINRSITGMSGGFEQIFGNSITNLGDNTEFYQDLESQVRDFLCGALGKKKTQVQNTLDDVEEQNKEMWGSGRKEKGGEVPPENSGQSVSSGLNDIAKKYFTQFMQNLGR